MAGLHMALCCAKTEAAPGVAETLAGTDAIRTPRAALPLTEAPGEALDRQLISTRPDYGADMPAVARYYNGPQYSFILAHPASKGVAVELAPFIRAGGYLQALSGGVSSTYTVDAAPNSGSALQSFTMGVYEGPDGEGKRYQTRGARCQPVWVLPADGPMRLQVTPFGGYSTPSDQALLTPTFNAGVPVAGAAGRTVSLTDGSTTWDDELIVRSLQITAPYAPSMRAEVGSSATLTASGYRLPCYLAPGRVVVEMEIETFKEATIALEAWLALKTNGTLLTGTIALSDSDGSTTHVCTHTLNGMRLASITPNEGPPRTDTLRFRCGHLTSASHVVAWT